LENFQQKENHKIYNLSQEDYYSNIILLRLDGISDFIVRHAYTLELTKNNKKKARWLGELNSRCEYELFI